MSSLASLRKLAVILGVSVAAAAPATAQTVTFNGAVNGIGAGTLQYSARESGGQYATSYRLQSGGLAGLFGSLSVSAEARGSVSGSSYRPSRYSENSTRGNDRDSKQISWSGTTPRVDSTTQRQRSHHIPASQASGHVDPATALHILFQNRSGSEICNFNFRMFDGARSTRLSANGRSGSGNTIQCNGTYSRLAGFSGDELAQGRNFAFTLSYRSIGNGQYQVQRFDVRAVRGRLSFTRR